MLADATAVTLRGLTGRIRFSLTVLELFLPPLYSDRQ
jgi:hypothetical protein